MFISIQPKQLHTLPLNTTQFMKRGNEETTPRKKNLSKLNK